MVMVAKRKDREFAELLNREDLTMEELVTNCHRYLEDLVPTQSRYKVTERPDVRTIRYYVQQKLLPPPVSYDGGRARYSGTHLIRLLLIKKLQAKHYTLRHIASELEASGEEQILGELFPEGRRQAKLDVKSAVPDKLSASKPPESQSMTRFPLPHGSSVDVPENVVRDANRRKKIVESLEDLARQLRNRGRREDDEG
jgi:DNA-binding transcriptional MerR regulator